METLHAVCTLLLGFLLVQSPSEDSVQESLKKGKEALAKLDAKKAIAHFTQAIKKDPKNAEALCFRGRSYGLDLEREKAISDFNEAITLEPKFSEAYYWRGRIRHELGNRKQALDNLSEPT